MAHDFLTVEPGSEVQYQIFVAHEPTAAAGVRWDDPDVGIAWTAPPTVISDRDAAPPPLAELRSRKADA
jgi:dTDP-4-dehydrorhamnose 3,5-epimerase